MILADLTIPSQWTGPAAFAIAIAVLGWLFKGKTDRWDKTADRSHEHAQKLQHHDDTLAAHDDRIEALETRKK